MCQNGQNGRRCNTDRLIKGCEHSPLHADAHSLLKPGLSAMIDTHTRLYERHNTRADTCDTVRLLGTNIGSNTPTRIHMDLRENKRITNKRLNDLNIIMVVRKNSVRPPDLHWLKPRYCEDKTIQVGNQKQLNCCRNAQHGD